MTTLKFENAQELPGAKLCVSVEILGSGTLDQDIADALHSMVDDVLEVLGRVESSAGWEPGHWWRVTFIREDGVEGVWAESSDEQEIRGRLATANQGKLYRFWRRNEKVQWRLVKD